jgi:two-component system, sensor histidine kinase and response regulator
VAPEYPVVDVVALDARLDRDWELLRDLTEVFEEDCPALTDALGRAVVARDATAAWRQAHTIKGMSGNLSAVRAERVALRIEQMGRSGTLAAEVDGLYAELCRELLAARDELRRLVVERCAR